MDSGEPSFTDPRPPAPNPDGPSWGSLSEEIGRWNGVYLKGEEVVLSYTVHSTEILEKPGSIEVDVMTAFTLTFQINESEEELYLTAAEVTDGQEEEVSGNAAYIYHGEKELLFYWFDWVKPKN